MSDVTPNENPPPADQPVSKPVAAKAPTGMKQATGQPAAAAAPVVKKDPFEEAKKILSPEEQLKLNLGTRGVRNLPAPKFPDADLAVRMKGVRKPPYKTDIVLVNPPTPDGAIWIRSQHRVGRRSRENMIWPQMELAQMAAILDKDYNVAIIDANAERMDWGQFEKKLRELRPRFYLTQVTAPTLTNDMYGCFLARSLGAMTMAFGTHVTPMPRETMEQFPALDFVLRGEPELILRELLDTLKVASGAWTLQDGKLIKENGQPADADGHWARVMAEADILWKPGWLFERDETLKDERMPATITQLAAVKGLVWRNGPNVVVNTDRPFVRNLDDLPIPRHDMLPYEKYRIPMIKGPYTFIVTSRGCTAGCKYCIKHVSYQYSIRLRTPENIMEELWFLKKLGVKHVHMYADLFTVSREQVINLCKLMIEQKIELSWTCNSRVDYVDEEMLTLMGKAGCNLISWGIESANEQILRKAAKGYRMEQAPRSLQWAHKAGIKNWGYFIIGLPGETVDTIQETIKFAKDLPLDVALFHVAAPYPGTPFFFEVLENNWFRADTQWEQVDMDKGTVLDYPGLKAEELEYWQKRAFREWAFRPGPVWTFIKSINGPQVIKSAAEIAIGSLKWALGKGEA
jgi:anaerobic magnesium-protoporphyrin IX monomethyl ester cyclase